MVSGTWEDETKKWRRAFRSQKPDDVVVIHSKFWRSPHWSYEFYYYFEIEHNDELEEQLFSQNKLVKLVGKDAEEAIRDHLGDPPDWFAPNDAEDYEIWEFYDDTGSNFRVLIDK